MRKFAKRRTGSRTKRPWLRAGKRPFPAPDRPGPPAEGSADKQQSTWLIIETEDESSRNNVRGRFHEKRVRRILVSWKALVVVVAVLSVAALAVLLWVDTERLTWIRDLLLGVHGPSP